MKRESAYGYKVGEVVVARVLLEDDRGAPVFPGTRLRIISIPPKVIIGRGDPRKIDRRAYFFNARREDGRGDVVRGNFVTIRKGAKRNDGQPAYLHMEWYEWVGTPRGNLKRVRNGICKEVTTLAGAQIAYDTIMGGMQVTGEDCAGGVIVNKDGHPLAWLSCNGRLWDRPVTGVDTWQEAKEIKL